MDDVKKLLQYFRESLRIDIHNIDAEIANQPKQHEQICREYAQAKSRLADVQMRVNQLKAERRRHYRAVIGGNPTVSEVDSHVNADIMYLRELEKVQDQEQLVDSWEGLREASKQRSFMFRELVTLLAAGLLEKDNIKPRDPGIGVTRRLEQNERGEYVRRYKEQHKPLKQRRTEKVKRVKIRKM